jgi:predicted phosphodiesterase
MTSLLIIMLFMVNACSKPEATVFEDNALSQEEMVKVCLVGDLGRDTPHQREIADALQREKCHRIFFLGDLVYPKGIKSASDPELQDKFLNYYQPLIDNDPNLVINLILGNHDHAGDTEAWLKVAKQNKGFFFPNYYYLVDYSGLCFIALDTSFYYYPELTWQATKQAAWLTRMDSRIKECKVKVGLTHHPLKGDSYSGSKDWKGASGALKAFLETGVIGKMDIHVAGHVHVLADDGKDDGTKMLISGTGGELRGDGPVGYIVLRWDPLNPKRIGYTLRKIDVDVNISEDLQAEEIPYVEDPFERD